MSILAWVLKWLKVAFLKYFKSAFFSKTTQDSSGFIFVNTQSKNKSPQAGIIFLLSDYSKMLFSQFLFCYIMVINYFSWSV